MDHNHHHQNTGHCGTSGSNVEDEAEYYDDEQEDGTGGGALMSTLVIGSPGSGASANMSASSSPNEYLGGHQGGAHAAAAAEELEKNLDDASNLLETETGLFHQRMWASFQSCARAIAQVYVSNKQVPPEEIARSQQQQPPQQNPGTTQTLTEPNVNVTNAIESENDHNLQRSAESSCSGNSKNILLVEDSFKSAAQHATTLYKDSLETSRRLIDLGIKTGSNRRTKEVLAFVKNRKKRFIRRDELISFLIGGSSASSGGKKDAQFSGGGRKHHHHNNQISGFTPAGALAGLFDGAYSISGLVGGNIHPQIYHMQQQQGQNFMNPAATMMMASSGGGFQAHGHHPANPQQSVATSTTSVLQQSSTAPTPNTQSASQQPNSSMYPQEQHVLPTITNNSNNPIASQSQPFTSFSSSQLFASTSCSTSHTPSFTSQQSQRLSNVNSTTGVPSDQLHDDDPTMLHLAVQQLFVASGNSSSTTGAPIAQPHEYTHTAGVKRPACPISTSHQHHHHPNSADEEEDIASSHRSRERHCNLGDDEDMMEDSVDGGEAASVSNFKRMRFY